MAGRTPDEEDWASQPTLSRLENAVTVADLLQLEEWFLERFVESLDSDTTQITLDTGQQSPRSGHQPARHAAFPRWSLR